MIDQSVVLPKGPGQQISEGTKRVASVACVLCLLVAAVGTGGLSPDLAADALGQLELNLVEWGSWLIGWLPLGLWVVVDLLLIRASFAKRSSAGRHARWRGADIYKIR